ncbi:MAG TPA: glucokinase [Syntrophales bacterium]|nr:glucokinase [Syntrophales bacterium]HOX93189.1 glucokinase [Syntrophales bacterium]HPI57633.1 glucokinase [Syntrophales bacterium]HPN25354.1 glucokinase [Syntrophales bacterium]HQM29646.1 glucokinase [Syntrophales bacterium]
MNERNVPGMLLVGDVGATKTDLAVMDPGRGPGAPIVARTFQSAGYASIEALLKTFLSQVNLPVVAVILGVAGPVSDGQSRITNLPWIMDEREIAATLGLRSVRLLNDLEALAYAVPSLGDKDIEKLNAGDPRAEGNRAIIAPGTGLGQAFLIRGDNRYFPIASEGGHTDFAPGDEMEAELLSYLRGFHDHVSYERVCSGIGIPNIYAFLLSSGYGEEPRWLKEELSSAADPTVVIVDAAMAKDRPCELTVLTLNMFVSILGAAAGNIALQVLSTGGVYLAGGIPPRILPYLTGGLFMERFLRKGRMSGLVSGMPVHVIVRPGCTLLGAALCGLQTKID